MENFLALFPEPRPNNVELFLFCHTEKLNYRVRLPGGQYLHLSQEIKFWLKKYNSCLLSASRLLCKEGDDPDLIDFSELGYTPLEIIIFFYLVKYSDDRHIIRHNEFACEVIMLSHLYAPLLTDQLLSEVWSHITTINFTSDVNTVKSSWKLVLLCEILNIKPHGIRRHILTSLKFFPHLMYEMDTSVDIEKMLSWSYECDFRNKSYIDENLCEIINCWKEGNEDKLCLIEMNQIKTPEQFFRWIEVDEIKRAKILNTIKLLMGPRKDGKSIVLIKNGSEDVRESLIKLILAMVDSSLVVNDSSLLERIPFTNSCLIDDYINDGIIYLYCRENATAEHILSNLDTYHTQDVRFVWNKDTQKFDRIVPKCWFLFDGEALKKGKIPQFYKRRIIKIDLSCQSELSRDIVAFNKINLPRINNINFLNCFKTYVELNG